MSKLYRYVGPAKIMSRAYPSARRHTDRVRRRFAQLGPTNGQRPGRDGYLVGTFVIDRQGELLLADAATRNTLSVPEVDPYSRQARFSSASMATALKSPKSPISRPASVRSRSHGQQWPPHLDRAHIAHPGMFTTQIVFRLCQRCGERNVSQRELVRVRCLMWGVATGVELLNNQ